LSHSLASVHAGKVCSHEDIEYGIHDRLYEKFDENSRDKATEAKERTPCPIDPFFVATDRCETRSEKRPDQNELAGRDRSDEEFEE